MTIKPLRDWLHFEPMANDRKVGLIHIPESKSTRSQTFQFAKVIAAGPQVELAKPGTTIYISEYAVEPFEVDGQPVNMMRERDIIGVIKK